jgi:hypothetical protein
MQWLVLQFFIIVLSVNYPDNSLDAPITSISQQNNDQLSLSQSSGILHNGDKQSDVTKGGNISQSDNLDLKTTNEASSLLYYLSAWASIIGLILSVVSVIASCWAARAAISAKRAARQAQDEIKCKIFQYSISSSRQDLDRLDDAVTNKQFSLASHLARTLADFMDEIANARDLVDKLIGENSPTRDEWNIFATELREWRTTFLTIPIDNRNKRLENIDEWCNFTSRVKSRINTVLGPIKQIS